MRNAIGRVVSLFNELRKQYPALSLSHDAFYVYQRLCDAVDALKSEAFAAKCGERKVFHEGVHMVEHVCLFFPGHLGDHSSKDKTWARSPSLDADIAAADELAQVKAALITRYGRQVQIPICKTIAHSTDEEFLNCNDCRLEFRSERSLEKLQREAGVTLQNYARKLQAKEKT